MKGIKLRLPQDSSKIEFPPPQICKEGSEAVLNYLRANPSPSARKSAVLKFLNPNGEKKAGPSPQPDKRSTKENPLSPSADLPKAASPLVELPKAASPPVELPKVVFPPPELPKAASPPPAPQDLKSFPSAKKIAFLIEYKEEKLRMPETSISSLEELYQKIRDRLKFGDGDVRIEIFDDEFDEYVTLDDFQLLQKTKHKLKVVSALKKEEGKREYYDSIKEKTQEQTGANIESDLPSKEVEKIRKLAEGNFGIVFEGKWRNRPVAIKEPKKMDEKFLKEVHLLR